ncbi:Leukotriene A-4 hydrolase-like protein [Zea mays]|uniref:Leukotriene A-4 hydrolase-like protein n=1 Tax=Zea mays TaxID=4577 RepID=A0A1D6FVX4_MAIZE|nr:Leukotriene A-4 hydrolase-like protein [Zea mays]
MRTLQVDLWRAKHREASTCHSRLFFGSRCQYLRHSRNFPTNKENRGSTDLYIIRWMQSKPRCKLQVWNDRLPFNVASDFYC